MRLRFLFMVLAVFLAASCEELPAADYAKFEEGLEKSSVKVNDVHLPGLVYSIDEQTARQYFQEYFADHQYNNALRVNLGYAVFHWGNNHQVLQKALGSVFLERLGEFFTGKDNAAIGRVMHGDKELHNHYFFMLCFLVELLNSQKLDAGEKQPIGQQLYAMLDASGLCEKKNQQLPTHRFPIINLLKAQLLLTCFSYADRCGRMESLKPLLNRQGTRKVLLDRYNLLTVDNAFFDELQLQAILAYMEAIPSHLRWPVAVTCYDKLVGKVEGGAPVSVHQFACAANMFNVFATRVGKAPGNQFPEDYRPVETDGFMIVFAHEHNHGVDGRYILRDPALKAYRQRLLTSAGSSRKNYLRGMFGDGFFQNNPQEFVASIANMYFCSSDDTFLYALGKARAGNYHPLGQFLLMASAYGDDESCAFYRIEPNGRTTVRRCAIEKTDGIVTSITYRGKKVGFTIEDGLVTGVSLP